MIRVITELAEIEKIKEEWTFLYDRCPYSTPFQSYAFIYRYIVNHRRADDDLYIVVSSNDATNKPVAILPALVRNGVLELIAQDISDFCNIIVDPAFDNYILYKTIAEHIKEEKRITKVKFHNLKYNSPLISSFKVVFDNQIVKDCNYFSYIDIEKRDEDVDFIDALRFINGKTKKNLRRRFGASQKTGMTSVLSKENGDPYPEVYVCELVNEMIASGIRTKESFSIKRLEFLKQLYEDSILLLAVYSSEGVVSSINYMMYNSKDAEYIKWIMLYKKSDYNMLLNLNLIQLIYQNDPCRINFARGIYDYKMINFHPIVKPLFSLLVYKTNKGYLQDMIHDLTISIKVFVYNLLFYTVKK